MAAPSMERFFMNIICCIAFSVGTVIAQKLCIMTVTGTRKSTNNQAPYLALYPVRILKPPRRAITPDSGTTIEAKGTPWLAPYAISALVKCAGPAMINIAE